MRTPDMPFRVVMVISSLQAGGAERVMSIMASYWADAGWDVHLITMNGTETPFYKLSVAVNHHQLDLSRPLGNVVTGPIRLGWRIRRLRAAIRQLSPDAVLSFLDDINIITVLATRWFDIPLILGQRIDPHVHPLNNPWRLLRSWAYRQATCVVAQTQHALDYFPPPIRSRGMVIPNPVVALTGAPAEQCRTGSELDSNRRETSKVLLGMGRLVQQKGFDYLIQAFAKVASCHPKWKLEIWGEGEERERLEAAISALGLSARVRLPGLTQDPVEKMRQADLFVLPSRYEGFPNVLCEAMACGLPVIAFDCPSGPAEIVHDGVNGILVPPGDVERLAAALDRLMSRAAERSRLASASPQVVQRFGLTAVMRQWTELISEHTTATSRS